MHECITTRELSQHSRWLYIPRPLVALSLFPYVSWHRKMDSGGVAGWWWVQRHGHGSDRRLGEQCAMEAGAFARQAGRWSPAELEREREGAAETARRAQRAVPNLRDGTGSSSIGAALVKSSLPFWA